MNQVSTIPRIEPSNPDEATGKAREILDQSKAKFGAHLNFFTTLANAPAVLDGYTGLSQALSEGGLSPKIREEIAVSVSGRNACGYCQTAHGHAARAQGVPTAELPDLIAGQVSDANEQAAVTFALQVLETRGQVSAEDLAAVRAAGYSDGEILEIIAHVAMTFFSNALNNVSDPVIDLPALPLPAAKKAA
ncbi:MAG: peroxidase-related enzyme [Verrucomicrobiota bacterium]